MGFSKFSYGVPDSTDHLIHAVSEQVGLQEESNIIRK